MGKYRLYWNDGTTQTVEGADIADAFSKAGYGGGAVGALDFYDNTHEQRYTWDRVNKKWVK